MPLKTFRSMRSLTNTLGKELFQEAEEWFFTANNESLYSFENICEYLLINSNYLRQGLLRWKTAQRKGHPDQLTANFKSGLR